MSDLWSLFEELSLRKVVSYLVVDGFDECLSRVKTQKSHTIADDRTDFIHRLAKCSAQSSNHILFVSRDDADLRLGFLTAKEAIRCTEYEITPSDTSQDIASFSNSVIEQRLRNKPDTLQRELAAEAAQKCEGMFLWIRLLHDRLSPGKNAMQLHDAVRNTPAGLDQAYDREIERIDKFDDEDRDRAIAILRWTLFAVRPLTVRELTEALLISLDGGDTKFPDSSLPDKWDDIYVNDRIKKPCGSLLDIRSRQPDDPLHMCTVNFVHFSVKQYLLDVFGSRFPSLRSSLFTSVSEVNDLLARACLRYMFYDRFDLNQWGNRISKFNVGDNINHYKFLHYAAKSWPVHVVYVETKTHHLRQLLNDLFEPSNSKWKWWAKLYYRQEDGPVAWVQVADLRGSKQMASDQTTPLYYAAMLGLTEVMDTIYQKISEQKNDTSQALKSDAFSQAAQAAAAGGHAEAVRFLLDHSARSPLQIEIPSFKVSPQKLLAFPSSLLRFLGDVLFGPRRRGVSVTVEELNDLLIIAAFGTKAQESEHIIRLCLSYGANPKHCRATGITALHGAAVREATNVIDFLLDRELSIDVASVSGLSPLHLASQYGCVKAAKLLLERGADVNMRAHGHAYCTPLHLATAAGHERIVQVLLHAGADLEAPVYVSQTMTWTPLCVAATLGHESIFELLLLQGAKFEAGDMVDCLTSCPTYQPEGIIQLLTRFNTDVNVISDGYTPLHRAILRKRILSVERLLTLGADIDSPDHRLGQAALHFAVRYNDIAMVQLLLKQGASVNLPDKHGRTAFHHAVIHAYSTMANFVHILESDGLHTEAQDEDGHTALHYAARSSAPLTIGLLVKSGGNVEATNSKGQRPLHLAFDNANMTQSILNSGAFVDPIDNSGATPFFYAAEMGATNVMERLLDAGADIDAVGPTRQNALDRALDKLQALPPDLQNDSYDKYRNLSGTVSCLRRRKILRGLTTVPGGH